MPSKHVPRRYLVFATTVILVGVVSFIQIKVQYNPTRSVAEQGPYIDIQKSKKQTPGGDALTLVTAYFNIGTFQKGTGNTYFTTQTYEHWSEIYRFVINPLVVYTDSKEFKELMQTKRKETMNITNIILLPRNSTWSFGNMQLIKDIYSQKSYPKHPPNTVVPGYACAMQAKYEVVARAAKDNFFNTRYFAWVDIGHFRGRHSSKRFTLKIPKSFNESFIGMSEVGRPKFHISPENIFKNNMVWVGGAFFLGERDRIIEHTKQFRRTVDYYLSQKLMNTDQQLLYAMYSESGRKHIKPTIELQLYRGKPTWFYLGTSMIQELD